MQHFFPRAFKLSHALIGINLLVASQLVWSQELDQIKNTTDELISISKQFEYNQSVSESEIKHALQSAIKRREALFRELKTDPQQIQSYFLDKSITGALPKQFNQYLEKEVEDIAGTIEVRAALYLKNKGESIQYLLNTEDGKVYYLHFMGNIPANLTSGTIVKLNKAYSFTMQNGFDELAVSVDDLMVIKEMKALPDAFGPQQTIAILVNFVDQPTNKPWSTQTVSDIVFNNTNRQYSEASYNQTTIVGNTIGWFTVPLKTTTDCNTIANNIPYLAAQAASNNGFDLSPYTRRIYFFPNIPSCGWAGLGNVGKVGTYSNAWINGYNDLRVVAHELGHNVGLMHSNRLQCTGSTPDNTCTHVEYGDYADTMGWGYGTHFNAFQKERLGWLNYGNSPAIQTVTTSGTYTIAPFEFRGNTPETNIKALKILKSLNTDGSKDYYYLEFRQPIGFDGPLGACGTSCDFTKGVLIHQGNSVNINSSYIIDPTANTTNPAQIALLPGQSFNDPNAPNGGITVTTNSVSTSGANVTIRVGVAPPPPPPTCVRGITKMSITPDLMQVVRAGEARGYAATITNNDSTGCAASQYAMYLPTTSTLMSGALSTGNIVLDPGKTATLSAYVWTNPTTPVGNYYFGVLAYNLSIPGGSYSVATGGFQVR